MNFDAAFKQCPLVAILRGIEPEQAVDVGQALVEAGFTLIEVPLNSPRPLISIGSLAERLSGRAVVGAGTVLNRAKVAEVAGAGGQIIVSPNTDPAVIEETLRRGMASLPGCFTPSEAFMAAECGANALKFFPAEAMSPAVIKAMAAVLPMELPRLVVGGIRPELMSDWVVAGAHGFGLGSSLYSAGASAETVFASAKQFISAWAMIRGASN